MCEFCGNIYDNRRGQKDFLSFDLDLGFVGGLSTNLFLLNGVSGLPSIRSEITCGDNKTGREIAIRYCPFCGNELISLSKQKAVSDEVLDTELFVLYKEKKLSGRVFRVLSHAGINTLRDLSRFSLKKLYVLPGMGTVALEEVESLMRTYGIEIRPT